MTPVLIVDDEQSARLRLRQLIERYEDLHIVGECATAEEARVQIASLAPKIVFLDIEMPGVSPLEMLRGRVLGAAKPAIVFVTAHAAYGVDAFDVGAADYLLKPFTPSRFAKALSRARERLVSATSERLTVRRTDGRTVALVPSEIVWIESAGNHVTLHLHAATLKLRTTMTDFYRRVRAYGFTRIHRSYAVNEALVRELEPWSHGEYVIVMEDGTRLNSSRSFKEDVGALLRPV